MLSYFNLDFYKEAYMARRKQCYSGIGGQAVLEGIMMKNGDKCAVAVRKADGTIEVKIVLMLSLG